VHKFISSLKASQNPKIPETSKSKPEHPVPSIEKPKTKPQKFKEHVAKPPIETGESKPALTSVKTSKRHGKLIFEPNTHWHSAITPLPPTPKPLPTPTSAQISALAARAASLFDDDIATYQASSTLTGKSASDTHFLNTILSKGTLSDRLSALTLLAQASPLHNTKALESLKNMAERGRGKGGREEGLKAMRCVVDWWVGGGAPARKLRYFRDQPLQHPSVTEKHLIAWHFEDWLKKYFFGILQILEVSHGSK
jgi:ribosome biogenesis protein MAK21